MLLSRLTLTDFRCYSDALLEPGRGFMVLTGENGAGKTNILEAVSLLVPGRGLRGVQLHEMARNGGGGGFAVNARLGDVELGTGTLAAAPDRRVVRINGAPASATALSEWLSIVWLTPAQDRLFTATPGERRRFLDRLVLAVDPGHAHHSARYEAAMRQRNRLLTGERPDPEWLTALEGTMVEHGAAIAAARADLIAELTEYLEGQPTTPFARASMTLEDVRRVADYRATRSRDAAAGRTLDGPHRQDLIVTHASKNQAAAQSSTGEQKALLLGIVLAHADLVACRQGRPPLLLLDEVAAHLDPFRRAALFERLAQNGGQVWMTGTERALFDFTPTATTHVTVSEGTIRQIE